MTPPGEIFCREGGMMRDRPRHQGTSSMVRTEIQLFLRNAPGELGKLADILADEDINIDAVAIQDASGLCQGVIQGAG